MLLREVRVTWFGIAVRIDARCADSDPNSVGVSRGAATSRRRTVEQVAMAISCRVISKMCTPTPFPSHSRPDSWEEVGDALLSEPRSHRRSRQRRMSREEGTVGV
jgi:hypothetical protein